MTAAPALPRTASMGTSEVLGFLRFDVTNLAYAIPYLKTGAVIGVGSGRDVLSQRLFGVSDVTGVEINPIIVDVLQHHFLTIRRSRYWMG